MKKIGIESLASDIEHVIQKINNDKEGLSHFYSLDSDKNILSLNGTSKNENTFYIYSLLEKLGQNIIYIITDYDYFIAIEILHKNSITLEVKNLGPYLNHVMSGCTIEYKGEDIHWKHTFVAKTERN